MGSSELPVMAGIQAEAGQVLGIQDLSEMGLNALKAPVAHPPGQWFYDSKPQRVAPGLPWVSVAATRRRKRVGVREAGGPAYRPQAQGPGAGLHQCAPPCLPGQGMVNSLLSRTAAMTAT